ncbi:MAG: peptide chain release factor N(5)-glutamine methyltransferase [Bdellovibrionaceae bacterium]|nr:peptide chain release factor N(5)-glutamine methyltransferase [Pseudobdellovibrionaceae bacterium]NUM57523.1 peptide chain release factor N(5)-glutamine methyltransferase [Pseudobdellovibrionaceae bacterium]
MILKEVLDKTINFFKQKSFETPRLDAELLLAYGLGIERIQLYLKFDQPLKEVELEKLREFVKRRSQGEPLAYIVGEKEFYKSTFKVTPAVLIPRPETETLVELAIEFLGNLSLDKTEDLKVLDLASGSGCIGISLAKEYPQAQIFAVEKSAEAIDILRQNANSILETETQSRFTSLLVDAENSEQILGQIGSSFDLIISNPPYIEKNDPELSGEVLKFEPSMALFADERGLYFILSWAKKYFQALKPKGIFLFEIGYKQGEELKSRVNEWQLYSKIEVLKDLSGKDRFLKLTK